MGAVDIVEFLRARYAERRALAEAPVQGGPWQFRPNENGADAGTWEIFGVTAGGTRYEVVGAGWDGGGVWQQADAGFIAANSPAEVLADLDAKERLLKVHAGEHVCAGWSGESYFDEEPCLTACLMAEPFAAHPDYDPLWVPGS